MNTIPQRPALGKKNFFLEVAMTTGIAIATLVLALGETTEVLSI